MNFFGVAKQVLKTLLSRKGRSFLTILGIVIGVAGVIIIIALGAGAQSLVLSQVTNLGTNLLSVQPGKSDEQGPPAQVFGIVVTTLVSEDAVALRDNSRVPHASAVVASANGTATVIWSNQDIDTNFVGTNYTYSQVIEFDMESGRFFDEREDSGNANVAVLGSAVRDELFADSGVDAIGQIIKIKNVPFKVIGVVAERGSSFFMNQDDQVFIPLEIAQKQLLGISHIQEIAIKVDAAENLEQTREDVKSVLMERHRIKREVDADFTVRNIADALNILSTITDAMRLFLTSMAAISLAVGGIGILNIMLVTVAERTREIGLRKAVGATKRSILSQFLLEAGTLTLLGGVIGIILGIIVSYLVALGARYAGFDWAFVVSITSILLAVGVSILTGLIFGLYPAFKAAKLNPIDALRYE